MVTLNAARAWYRHNGGGVFIPQLSSDTVPVSFFQHASHSEAWFLTTSGFTGSFTIYAVPTNSTAEASKISVWVDGVYNQTVAFDVTTNLNKLQAVVVNVGTTGVRTIRIQEGERDPGCFLVKIDIDGAAIPAPAIVRSYTVLGDSVAMGAVAAPRSLGWAHLMKGGGSRFDQVNTLGQSGYSMNVATIDAPNIALRVREILPTCANYIGSTENVVALALSLNDWITSAISLSAATFQTRLTSLVDALKTAADAQGVPGFKIMLHTPTRCLSGESAPNDKGSTLADFSAAAQAVATARPTFTQYLYLFNSCLDADMGDVVHPSVVGHGKIYSVVLAAT